MHALLTHVAGVDVHKKVLVITALIGKGDEDPVSHIFECLTFTEDLEKCGRKLLELGVKDVAMESTGCYWKPVYNVWSAQGLRITLGNATHIKNVPGRKTDVSDSRWIAELHRFGLIRPSYIPEIEFRELRALNRHRANLVGDLARVKNRVSKVLEDGNLKLSSVLSDIFGVAGLAVLTGIAQGKSDPYELIALIQTEVKKPKEEIQKALIHCLTEIHRFQIQEYLIQYKHLQQALARFEDELNKRIEPYSKQVEQLMQIPGVNLISARGLIAEATTKMENFRDDRRFAAWAGVAPGNYQSAGKRKKVRIRHGNPVLKKILVQIARGAVKKKGSYYKVKYGKLTLQTGSKNKATVAIANRIARVVFHLLSNPDKRYRDIGPLRIDSVEQQIKRKIGQLRALGVEVSYQTLQKITVQKTVAVSL